jgi:hypothetical protein
VIKINITVNNNVFGEVYLAPPYDAQVFQYPSKKQTNWTTSKINIEEDWTLPSNEQNLKARR